MRQELATNRISIGDAAEQFGVSRRTLERWIRAGRLGSVPSAKDARRRMVDPDEVAALVRNMQKRNHSRASSPENENPDLVPDDQSKQREIRPDDPFSEAVDDTLQLVYSQYHRLISQLHPESFRELTLADLQSGPLGRDLQCLAAIARDEAREPADLTRSAVDSILQVLFWPAAAEDYTVPRSFWDTDLGRMLAQVKFLSYKPTELMSIGAAVELLGVPRPTIYRWMDDRTLEYVRDDASGRTFVIRRDVVNLKRVATELAAQEAMRERALARKVG